MAAMLAMHAVLHMQHSAVCKAKARGQLDVSIIRAPRRQEAAQACMPTAWMPAVCKHSHGRMVGRAATSPTDPGSIPSRGTCLVTEPQAC